MATTTSNITSEFTYGPDNNFGADIPVETPKIPEVELNKRTPTPKPKKAEVQPIPEQIETGKLVDKDIEKVGGARGYKVTNKVPPTTIELLPRESMKYDVITVSFGNTSAVKGKEEIAERMKQGYDVHGLAVDNGTWHILMLKCTMH